MFRSFGRLTRRSWMFALGLLALGGTACSSSNEDPPARHTVLFFTRSAGFEHEVIKRDGDGLSYAEKAFTELGKKNGFEVVCTKNGTVFDGDLSPYDAIFFYTTGDLTDPNSKDGSKPMSPEGKKKLLDAIASGKGFLASHCGADTFHSPGERFEEQNPPDPYIAMLGGEFIKHGKQQEATMVVASPNFPGLAGVGDSFRLMEEWYSLKNFSPDLHVILAQDTQGMEGNEYERPAYPATWTRMYDKGRVFYTSMGHREDVWDNPTFQQILLGGLRWACGDVDADVTSNVERICPGAHVMPKPALTKPKEPKEESPKTEAAPKAEETPKAEVPPKAEETPKVEEAPKTEEAPKAKEVPQAEAAPKDGAAESPKSENK